MGVFGRDRSWNLGDRPKGIKLYMMVVLRLCKERGGGLGVFGWEKAENRRGSEPWLRGLRVTQLIYICYIWASFLGLLNQIFYG